MLITVGRETPKGTGERTEIPRVESQILRHSLYGRHDTGSGIGKRAGVFRGRDSHAPLRIHQRLLPQARQPYIFGYH